MCNSFQVTKLISSQFVQQFRFEIETETFVRLPLRGSTCGNKRPQVHSSLDSVSHSQNQNMPNQIAVRTKNNFKDICEGNQAQSCLGQGCLPARMPSH